MICFILKNTFQIDYIRLMSVLEKLSVFDDPLFRFDPTYHAYSYNGKKLTSVTKIIQTFHEPFDQEKVSLAQSEKLGIPQEEILRAWKEKNQKSIFVGHTVHEWIENYYKQQWQPLPSDASVIGKINSFNVAWSKFLHKLTPVAFEKKIFHADWGIAGTLDSLFSFNDKLIILDYKTNGEFKDDHHPDGHYKKLFPPFEDLWQNHFNEYSIQVSLYSLILKEIADIHVDRCFLLHLSEDKPTRYEALNLQDRLLNYFNQAGNL